MGINFGGIAAAYRGFKEDQLQQADEARRAKADTRADQDHAFQEEARSRNRKEWKKTDDIESRKQADIAAIAAELDEEGKAVEAAQDSQSDTNFKASLVDAEEQGTPYIGEAKGIPKPIKFNDVLSRQQKLLQRQLSRADIDPAAYAAANESINKMQKEGVNDALELFAQGRYQEGLDKFNSTGSYRGSRLLSARQGETDLGGVKQPTHFVTVTGADGRPIEIDTARAQFQNALSLKDRLAHTDNVLKTNAQIKHYADTAKHGEGQLKISQQQADTQERYRADQAANMREQRRLQELSAANGGASGAARAPIWDKDADKRIEDLYTSKDPNTGESSVDTSGALFAKRAGLYLSYANGGDTFSAANKAKDQDNKMKLAAGNDPAKLAALRQQYLSILSQAGQPSSAGSVPSVAPPQGSAQVVATPQPQVAKIIDAGKGIPKAIAENPAMLRQVQDARDREAKIVADRQAKASSEANRLGGLNADISGITPEIAASLDAKSATSVYQKYRDVLPTQVARILIAKINEDAGLQSNAFN